MLQWQELFKINLHPEKILEEYVSNLYEVLKFSAVDLPSYPVNSLDILIHLEFLVYSEFLITVAHFNTFRSPSDHHRPDGIFL